MLNPRSGSVPKEKGAEKDSEKNGEGRQAREEKGFIEHLLLIHSKTSLQIVSPSLATTAWKGTIALFSVSPPVHSTTRPRTQI